ncbi:hypothetical protein HCN44_009512 [Aphidius gifuensis]|uniref:Lipocalin/cytosolic fatty-acid binding domain-containing protein n=1 Tax=Aphidius gifuensis TaxID=684658 RepID=A0A835CVI1_APHGI|nr:apolipoprotein D-like [Aphidius gifuensis]KAF7998114.1 hypothetical protein HCN44_009512 [Aphidius gifuensis]
MFLILIFSLAFASSFAQIPNFGNRNLTPMENFNKSAFAGQWYIVTRTPNIFEAGQNCPVFTHSLNEQTGSFNSVLSTKSAITKEYRLQTATNEAIEDHPSVFNSYYDYLLPMGQFAILSTDYKNYAVAALAYPKLSSSYLQIIWVYSRTPVLAHEYYQIASECLAANKIPAHALKPAKQSDC